MTAIVQVAMRDIDGTHLAVGAQRWFRDPERADFDVLDQARGPVLDIGCGPGRHAAELARRGIPALGIDITGRALDIARRRGASVIERSVFERVPGTGRWGSVLLLDGNIGIGGDPEALLLRVRALLAPDGIALVEVDPRSADRRPRRVQLEIDGEPGPMFRWSRVGLDDLDDIAKACGFVVARWWHGSSRWFARLEQSSRT